MNFLESVAENPKYSASYGDDLMWCFYSIAATSADPQLSERAHTIGLKLAQVWSAGHTSVPSHASASAVAELVFGAYVAECLGVPNTELKAQLRQAASRYSIQQFLAFDPRQGPPQSTLGRSRYDIYCDALIASYTGDLYGITLGAPWPDVVHWLPAMRPYTVHPADPDFYDVLYAVTHTVYTFNDYSQRATDPACLRPEFEFLRANLPAALALRDPEILGEFIDTLRSFGVTPADPQIRQAMHFLQSSQNPDGSWGDPHDPDIYNRYHATWTALDGLREYRFGPAKACPVK